LLFLLRKNARSIANTAALFYGSNASRVQQSNIDFMLERGLFPKVEPFGLEQHLDKGSIKSGDNMQVLKLDGLDQLIAWGTGGRTGHTTVKSASRSCAASRALRL
jgi:hypothetical protein